MKYKIWMGKVIFTIKYGIHMSEFYGETVFSFSRKFKRPQRGHIM